MKRVFKNTYAMNLLAGFFFFLFCFIPTAKATHRPFDTISIHLAPTTVTAPQGGSFTITFTLVRRFTGGGTSVGITPLNGMSIVLNQPTITNCNLVAVESSCTRTATYTVLADAGPITYNTSTQAIDSISVQGMSDILSLTVTGTPRTLTVAKTGAGSGTITSSPAGINCGAACSASFIAGTSITLTASALAGSVFNSWIAGPCFGAGPTCTFTLLDNTTPSTTPTAQFDLISRTLAITKNGTGTGTVTCNFSACAASYLNGTSLTLRTTPNAGSIFAGWSFGSGSAGVCTGTDPCTFTITANSSVTATFNATAPSIATVNPASGTNDAAIALVSVTGTNFQSGAAVKLTRTGQPDIVCAGVTFTSSTTLSGGSCPITGAVIGAWNVVVTNPDAQFGTLTNGFSVSAPLLPPAVTTVAVTSASITETGATINGTVNPNGSATTGWFVYNTTTASSCSVLSASPTAVTTSPVASGSGNTAVSYSQPLTGLTAGTTYYFCAIAQNSAGFGYGNILLLATTAPPASTSYSVIKSEGSEFSGWAWGGHVLGWLSFSHLNCDTNGNGFMDINDTSAPAGCPPKDGITPIPDYKVWIAGTLPNAPPVASDLQSTFLDRCSANPFEQTMTFNYSDNEGDPMAQYAINVYDFACDANKNQLIDSGVSCVNTAGATVVGNDTDTVLKPAFSITQTYTSLYNINPAPQEKMGVLYPYTNAGGELTWAKTYYFTVEVRDPDHLN